MPGGDGTGPMGMGAMTGRGLGYCAGSPAAGYVTPGGWGRGGGRGLGNRRRNRFFAYDWFPWGRGPVSADVGGKELLQKQAEVLKRQLDEVQARISGMDSSEK